MADFSFEIHRCAPGTPEYNLTSSQMEAWKIKSRLKSTHPRSTWEIEIRGRTNAEKDLILAHYNGQGGYNIPFNWIVTPIFFSGDTPTTRYVRYKEFKYSNPPGVGNIWDFVIVFVEEFA